MLGAGVSDHGAVSESLQQRPERGVCWGGELRANLGEDVPGSVNSQCLRLECVRCVLGAVRRPMCLELSRGQGEPWRL